MSVRGEERKFQIISDRFKKRSVFVYSALPCFGLRKPFCWGGVKKLTSAFFCKSIFKYLWFLFLFLNGFLKYFDFKKIIKLIFFMISKH